MRPLLEQRADDDCTICAIAMATGLPYERVLAVAATSEGGYRYQGVPGTMSPKGVLIDLGFNATRVMPAGARPALVRGLLWGRRAIVSLPSQNGFTGHHDVYWDGEEIRDPSRKSKYAPEALLSLSPLYVVILDERASVTASKSNRKDGASQKEETP